jgi:MSHA biogenesis protein MshO
MTHSPQHLSGFTLVEILVALTLSAVVIGTVAMFMTAPTDVYFTQQRRSELVDDSGDLTRQLALDLSHALPNSVRIRNSGSRAIVEMLLVRHYGMYRPSGEVGVGARELDFSVADQQFAFHPQLNATLTSPYTPAPPLYAVVENRGTAGFNAYAMKDVIAGPINVNPNPTAFEDGIELPAPFKFRSPSNNRRVFMVTGPVTYICNSASGTAALRRYAQYPISPNIPTSESSAQLSKPGTVTQVIGGDVSACRFSCGSASSAPCTGSITADFGIKRTLEGSTQSMRVFRTFALDNRS